MLICVQHRPVTIFSTYCKIDRFPQNCGIFKHPVQWTSQMAARRLEKVPFGSPMEWQEPSGHDNLFLQKEDQGIQSQG